MPVFPATKTIEKEERIAKTEVVFHSPFLARDEVLSVVPDNGLRDIDTSPCPQPKLPAEINVFAIHEENALVEALNLLKSFSAQKDSGARTPCGLARFRIINLRMFKRLLPRFTNADCGIHLDPVQQSLETPILQLRIRIQHKDEIAGTLPRQQVHSSGESIVGERTKKVRS